MKAKERVLSGIVRTITNAEKYPWPPLCVGVIYQPERPVTKRTIASESASSVKNDSSTHQSE